MRRERNLRQAVVSSLERLFELAKRIIKQLSVRARVKRELDATYLDAYDLFWEAPHAYFTVDHRGRTRMVNRKAAEMLGYTHDDLVGWSVFDLYAETPAGKDKARELFTRFRAGKEIRDEELEMRRADGASLWISLSVKPIRDKKGDIVLSSIVVDITERKRAANTLRQYTDRLRVLLEIDKALLSARPLEEIAQAALRNMRILVPYKRASILEFDLDANEAKVVAANFEGETKVGPGAILSAEESAMLGELRQGNTYTVEDILRLQQPSPLIEILQSEGLRSYVEFPLIASGELIGSLNVGRDAPGIFAGEVADIAREVAGQLAVAVQQARLRQDLQRSADRYRSLFEGVPIGLYRTTPRGEIIDANPALAEILGYSDRESLLKVEAEDIYTDPEERALWKILMEQHGVVHGHELRARRQDGAVIWLLANARAVRDPAGRVLYYEGSLQDVTERKHTQQRIQEQLHRITTLRNIDMAICTNMDLHVILNVLVDQVTTHLGADAADVLLFNPYTQMLDHAVAQGFRTTALKQTRLGLGEGYAGLAAQEGRILSIRNLAESPGDFVRAPLLAQENFIAYHAAPLIAKGRVMGVLEIFHRTPFEPDPEWLEFLEAMAAQAAIGIDNATLFNDLQRANFNLTVAYDSTLEGWTRALDLRDKETEGHTRRVTELTVRLARVMGVTDEELVNIRRGALLHDIGKMGIPDSILLKVGQLSDEEWEIMHRHPVYARELLATIPHLRSALDIPYCHHENWDGTGYPRGLRGEQIPLAARIFAVADVWDALRSDRPYRPAWPEDRAHAHIREQAGKRFDPAVVDAFLRLLDEGPGIPRSV